MYPTKILHIPLFAKVLQMASCWSCTLERSIFMNSYISHIHRYQKAINSSFPFTLLKFSMVLTETPPHLFCSPDLVIQLGAFSLQLLLFLRCLDAAAKAPFVAEEPL